MAKKKKTTVAIIYNHFGEDIYEKIRKVDPASWTSNQNMILMLQQLLKSMRQ